MKKTTLCLLYFSLTAESFSQIDSLKNKNNLSFGTQIGGQIVSAIEQNWVNDFSGDGIIPFYTFGFYIKKQRHTLDINILNNSFKSKDIVPFISYYCKFNKTQSPIDINATARFYSYFSKYKGVGNIKHHAYSENAFCYGVSLVKRKKKLAASFAVYNYVTFSSYNKIFTDKKRTLPELYGEEWSLDMLAELKLMYRINN